MLSDNIMVLEIAFSLLNDRFFENALSMPVITVQSSPKSFGHCSNNRIWKNTAAEQDSGHYEINISAEYLALPLIDTITTLLHEMVHQYNSENGVQDCSRGNTYHNKKFKAEAERRGLIIGYDKRMGHSPSTPAPELIAFVEQSQLGQLTFQRTTKTMSKAKKKSSTRKYCCPNCKQSVRATKKVNIYCGDCDLQMICENPEEEAGEFEELSATAASK